MPMFPYDVAELADGPIRCMYAPMSAAIPTGFPIASIDPYAPVSPWEDFGATAGPFVQARNIAAASYRIQQTSSVVRERVTETTRTVQLSVAEMRPEIISMIENGPGVTTVAAGGGASAASKVPVGDIEDLTQYRMAFIGRRGKDQGIVEEAGTTRGRMFAFIAYRCALGADNVSWSLADGDLANAAVTFRLFPEPGQPSAAEHGFWIFENAGSLD